MRGSAIVDTRNMLDPAAVRGRGPGLRRRRAPLMAHVLLAGGAGFIGSHLADRLLERGDTVVCVDDLSTGSRAHVKAHAKDDRYWFVESRHLAAGAGRSDRRRPLRRS